MKTSKYTSGAVIPKGDISVEVLSAENLAKDWILKNLLHVNEYLTSELKSCQMKRRRRNVRYYPGMFLEEIRKTTKTRSRDNLCRDRYLN